MLIVPNPYASIPAQLGSKSAATQLFIFAGEREILSLHVDSLTNETGHLFFVYGAKLFVNRWINAR